MSHSMNNPHLTSSDFAVTRPLAPTLSTADANGAHDSPNGVTATRDGDVYIASCLVDCMPPMLTGALTAIAAMAEASVYTHSDAGRIVVVLEAASSFAVVRAIDAIRALPGVVNLNMVYQHVESAAAMNESIHPQVSAAQRENAQPETP